VVSSQCVGDDLVELKADLCLARARPLFPCSKVYSIEPSSRFTVRLTAGRIVPAVATCTAAVTGLGMLELYKLLQVREQNVQCASTLLLVGVCTTRRIANFSGQAALRAS
jgi:hypothetical protein